MTLKKKYFAFASIFLMFLLGSSFIYRDSVKVDASNELEFNESGDLVLGHYFKSVEKDINAEDIMNHGTINEKLSNSNLFAYDYNGKTYGIIIAQADTEATYLSEACLSDKTPTSQYNGNPVAFKYESIEWSFIETGDDYAKLVPNNILERRIYNDTPVDFNDSQLCNFLNNIFIKIAFSEEEKAHLLLENDKAISIPTKSQLDKSNIAIDYPTDFAILSNLSNHEKYENAPFWTKDLVYSRVAVKWNQKGYTNCLSTDEKIGVLPVIKIKYSPKGGSGGSSGNSTSRVSSVDKDVVKFIVGGVMISISIAFLIVFFKKWSKKVKENEKYKLPKWQYALVGGGLLICIIGLFVVGSGSFVGTSGNSVVGWYQGNMADGVGFGERLSMNLTKDGKVYRYVGDAWSDEPGSATNWTYIRQDGVGTYTYSKGKLIINAAPEWHLNSWEKQTTIYTDVHGLGSFIKYEGYEGTAYSWYHYSNIDSKGIASIKNNDTRDLKWA